MNKIKSKYQSMPIKMKVSLWFLICTIIQRSISVIATPIFTRLLSAAEYGKYSIFMSWSGVLACFVTMYIYSGIYPQAIVKFKDSRAIYSSAMQGLTVTLVIFWLIFYLAFASLWNGLFSLNTSQMIAMFVIMWGHAVFSFWSTEQRVDYLYKKLVAVTLVEAVLQLFLCIVLICLSENKVSGLVWGIAFANILCYGYLFFSQVSRGKVFFSKEIWIYTLKLAIPLIPHFVSSVLLNSSDRIMIQKMEGDAEAGIYSLAYTVSITGTLINQAMLQTLEPWVFEKIKARSIRNIKVVFYPVLLFIVFVNLIILLFAPEIMRIFAPNTYSEAIWVMPPVVMSVFFMFMYNFFSFFSFYYDKGVYISMATGIGTILNIILNYVFIKIYGYYAAGYTTLLCYIIFSVTHYHFMKKTCGKEFPNENIFSSMITIGISIVFLLVGFIIMTTYNYPVIRYGMAALVMIICVFMRKSIRKYIFMIFEMKNKM